MRKNYETLRNVLTSFLDIYTWHITLADNRKISPKFLFVRKLKEKVSKLTNGDEQSKQDKNHIDYRSQNPFSFTLTNTCWIDKRILTTEAFFSLHSCFSLLIVFSLPLSMIFVFVSEWKKIVTSPSYHCIKNECVIILTGIWAGFLGEFERLSRVFSVSQTKIVSKNNKKVKDKIRGHAVGQKMKSSKHVFAKKICSKNW